MRRLSAALPSAGAGTIGVVNDEQFRRLAWTRSRSLARQRVRSRVNDGYLRIAAATPKIRVGDVAGNAAAILECVDAAVRAGARVLALPELCLTGYTCGDLFHDRALLARS